MKKTLRIVGISVAVVLGLLVVAAVALTLVFDPNQYKGEVIKLVKDKTGRDLKIEKKIGWSFFPRLGVEAGGLELSNAPGFGKEPFARIDAAGVHVAVLPLLRGQVEVTRLYLHGLDLNLAKNAAGRNNWDDLAAAGQAPAPAKPEPKGIGKLPIEGVAVGRLEIKRAGLNWRDQQSGSQLAVRNLELTTGRFVANQPMDLNLGLELVRDRAAPIKAALAAQVTASADALKLAKVDLKVDDSRLQGTIEVRNFASPALRFDLALDKIDLDRYLADDKAAAKPAAAPAKGAAAPASKASAPEPVELPLSTLRSLDINGQFRIGALKAMGLHSSDAKIQINAKNGLITLGPNSAKLYQGQYRGETAVDVRGKQPQLRIDENLEQVQLGPLLKDMQLFDHYSGAGNIALKLTAQGFDANAIKRSLNGNAAVAVKDGRIDGIDLGKAIKALSGKADALTKLTRIVPDKGDHTVFGQMNATFQIANGIANNRDLIVRAADFVATGRGTADLVNEKMDYRLELANVGDEGRKCKTFPLRVEGAFANLSYLPDLETILGCQAQKQMEKGLEKGLQQLLQPKKKRK